MTEADADALRARIQYDRKMSGGTMPIEIIVADDDERALGLAICKSLRGVRNLSFVTTAELVARIGREARHLKRQFAAPAPTKPSPAAPSPGAPSDDAVKRRGRSVA